LIIFKKIWTGWWNGHIRDRCNLINVRKCEVMHFGPKIEER